MGEKRALEGCAEAWWDADSEYRAEHLGGDTEEGGLGPEGNSRRGAGGEGRPRLLLSGQEAGEGREGGEGVPEQGQTPWAVGQGEPRAVPPREPGA